MTFQNRGHWEFEGDIPESTIGFIYRVDLPDGRYYIGRRMIFSTITKPPLAGKRRKRKVTKESNWGEYTTSSVTVNEYIELNGKFGITFKIIQFCTTKSQMSYFEVYWIMMTGSMTNPLGLNKNCSRVPCRPLFKKTE